VEIQYWYCWCRGPRAEGRWLRLRLRLRLRPRLCPQASKNRCEFGSLRVLKVSTRIDFRESSVLPPQAKPANGSLRVSINIARNYYDIN